jgi:hypothetical protein
MPPKDGTPSQWKTPSLPGFLDITGRGGAVSDSTVAHRSSTELLFRLDGAARLCAVSCLLVQRDFQRMASMQPILVTVNQGSRPRSRSRSTLLDNTFACLVPDMPA